MKPYKKLSYKYYGDVDKRIKNFEIRKEDDCKYSIGDTIFLSEVDEFGKPTGRETLRLITYRLDSKDFSEGIKEGYVILGIN